MLSSENGGFLREIAFGTALVSLGGMSFTKVQGSKTMANFTNFTRSVTAAVGALLISTACVAAAVGPATSGHHADDYAAVHVATSGQVQQA